MKTMYRVSVPPCEEDPRERLIARVDDLSELGALAPETMTLLIRARGMVYVDRYETRDDTKVIPPSLQRVRALPLEDANG